MSLLTEVTGVAASLFTSVALLPQLVKILREKNAEGISWLMLFSLFVGLGLWIVYGCMKSDLIISISNAFAWLVNATVMILTRKFTGRTKSAKTTDRSKGAVSR